MHCCQRFKCVKMPPGSFYFSRIGEVMEVPILVSESILHIHFIHCQFGKRKTFISFQSANLQPISLLFTPFLFKKKVLRARMGPREDQKGTENAKKIRRPEEARRGQKGARRCKMGNKGKKGARRPGLAGPWKPNLLTLLNYLPAIPNYPPPTWPILLSYSSFAVFYLNFTLLSRMMDLTYSHHFQLFITQACVWLDRSSFYERGREMWT